MNAELPPALPDARTADAERVATRGTILLTVVGTTVHGCGVDDQDDRDELGICVEPAEYVIGLRRFQQYESRTQPTGVRSGPGDLDRTVYSLRKWMRLALQGNPTILVPLFTPVDALVLLTEHGRYLRAHPELVLSRQAGLRFLGYLNAQREKLLGRRGDVPSRPELVERYGFDTKFAYHMVRLGLQGVELLDTGRFTLPVPEPDRSWLVALRRGEHTLAEALDRVALLEVRLGALLATSALPPTPDYDRANAWLVDVHHEAWEVM